LELFDFDNPFLFQEILTNLFQPLFEVTKDPSSHPALHRYPQHWPYKGSNGAGPYTGSSCCSVHRLYTGIRSIGLIKVAMALAHTQVAAAVRFRVGIKKPTQKNPPKKTHLKKPTKNGFFGFF
jgi:hypothetical protein